MKKALVIILALATTGVAAQSSKRGESAPPAVYTLEQTSLRVAVAVRHDIVRRGPYARFAQRYLGAMAPLADKDIYAITSARIESRNESDLTKVYVSEGAAPAREEGARPHGPMMMQPQGHGVRPHGAGEGHRPKFDTLFPKVQIDRLAATEKGLEESAAAAANTIFNLRKRRMELITGEAGEHVFGEGLKAALQELDKLEAEYVSLFLGKTVTVENVRFFTIVPQPDKTNNILFRFSDTAGVLPASDLNGQPIVLEIKPEGDFKPVYPTRGAKDTRPGIYQRIPQPVVCRLVDGMREIASSREMLAQWGVIADIPVGSGK